MTNWLQRLPVVAALLGPIPPGQFGRYLLVGLWNTVFGYSLYAGFTVLFDPIVPCGYGYIVAAAAANLVSVTVAFLAYKWFVFKTKGNYLREWMRCAAVYGGGVLLNLILLPLLVEAIRRGSRYNHQAPYIAGAILIGFSVIYSFVGHKKFSFRPPS